MADSKSKFLYGPLTIYHAPEETPRPRIDATEQLDNATGQKYLLSTDGSSRFIQIGISGAYSYAPDVASLNIEETINMIRTAGGPLAVDARRTELSYSLTIHLRDLRADSLATMSNFMDAPPEVTVAGTVKERAVDFTQPTRVNFKAILARGAENAYDTALPVFIYMPRCYVESSGGMDVQQGEPADLQRVFHALRPSTGLKIVEIIQQTSR